MTPFNSHTVSSNFSFIQSFTQVLFQVVLLLLGRPPLVGRVLVVSGEFAQIQRGGAIYGCA
jgi:hypothetical protein